MNKGGQQIDKTMKICAERETENERKKILPETVHKYSVTVHTAGRNKEHERQG